MLEILRFTFESFWHFVGVLILATAIPSALGMAFAAVISAAKSDSN